MSNTHNNNNNNSNDSSKNDNDFNNNSFAELCYVLGNRIDEAGLARLWKRSIECFEDAAKMGHVRAQYRLGRCLYEGAKVPQDKTRAVYWLRRAAHAGHAGAQLLLGAFLRRESGPGEGQSWIEKAAKNEFLSCLGVSKEDQKVDLQAEYDYLSKLILEGVCYLSTSWKFQSIDLQVLLSRDAQLIRSTKNVQRIPPSPKSPSWTAEKKSPSSTAEKKSPSSTAEKKSPSSTAQKKSPSSTAEKKSPSSIAQKKSPSSIAEKKSPSSTAQKRNMEYEEYFFDWRVMMSAFVAFLCFLILIFY